MERRIPNQKISASSGEISARLYLSLLRRCLVRDLFPDQRYEFDDVEHSVPYSKELREDGKDWPTEAETMVGSKRLQNLEDCCWSSVVDAVPGDFVETGIWRGGCGILMRAVLEALQDDSKRVWLFDSFEGLPRPDAASFPKDEGDSHWTIASYLGVGLDEVRRNFQNYDLLDHRVHFIKGWFRDTIPDCKINAISVLRLDGDMYESTWLALSHLYPKLSHGGFVIVDDYGAVAGCKAAVDQYRARSAISSPIVNIDWTGIFWRK